MSEWGLVRVGLCPVGLCLSGVLSSGVFIVAYFSMLYGDTLTLIKQKITNIVVFESICSRPKGVLSEWG